LELSVKAIVGDDKEKVWQRGRVVVIGDSDFANNTYSDAAQRRPISEQ
jgi:hypothetical protein